jgi:hypothetical protein
MTGWFTWAKEKVGAAKERVLDWATKTREACVVAVEKTSNAIDFVMSILTYPAIKDLIENMQRQALQAFKALFNPATLKTMHDSAAIRAILIELVKINMLLLSVVKAKQTLEDMSDPEERAYFESLVINLLWVYIIRLGYHNVLDVLALVMRLVRSHTNEHTDQHDFIPCACKPVSRIKASLDYPVDYLGRRAMVALLTYFLRPYCWGLFAFPFRAIEEGQNLLSYRLDAAGICARHQTDLFAVNNTYCFIFGGALVVTTEMASRLLSNKSDETYGPAYALIYPFFVLAALSIAQALPNKKGVRGLDIFNLGRRQFKLFIKYLAETINYTIEIMNTCFQTETKGTFLEMIDRTTRHVLSYIPSQFYALFLDWNLHSLEKAMTRKSINDLIALNGENYLSVIKLLKRINGFSGTPLLSGMTHVLPVSDTVDLIAGLLANPKLMPVLRRLQKSIEYGLEHRRIEAKRQMLLTYRDEKLTVAEKSPNELTAGWVEMVQTSREDEISLGDTRVASEKEHTPLTDAILIEDYVRSESEDKDLTDWTEVAPLTSSRMGLFQQASAVTPFSRQTLTACRADGEPKASGIIRTRCVNARVGC